MEGLTGPNRLTEAQFEAVIEAALRLLPREVGAAVENMAVIIEERPSPAERAEVGIGPHDWLFGLYRGIPLTARSFFSPGGNLPQQIILFKAELEDCCLDRTELIRQITLTLIHEVGHYLGLNEEELHHLETYVRP